MWPAKLGADAIADVAAKVDVEPWGPVPAGDFVAAFELHPQITSSAAVMNAPATRLLRRCNAMPRTELGDECMRVSVRVASGEIQDASTTDRVQLSHTSSVSSG
jgi:hypothetical protein